MKIKSLSLRSIGPFIEADMEFFDDSDEKPPVVLVTGENGTGKSIILDAIRGMFGVDYCKLERDIRSIKNKTSAQNKSVFDHNQQRFSLISDFNQCSHDERFVLRNEIVPTERFFTKKGTIGMPIDRIQYLLPAIPENVQKDGECPNWIVDFWASTQASGSYKVDTLKSPNHKNFLIGSLQGGKKKSDITELICHFDYLRDSRDPQEKATGDKLYEILEKIIALSLLEGGKLSHVARSTYEPIIIQNGQAVAMDNLSSGNAYLIQNMVSLLSKMYSSNFIRRQPLSELCQTPGILLIDEAENQLHPKWQKRFIRSVLEIFPNLQIIATTHSPFIISSVPNAKLFVCKSKTDHCIVTDETAQYSNKPIDEILMSPLFEETLPFNEEISKLIEERKQAVESGDKAKRDEIEAKLKAINPQYFSYFDTDKLLEELAKGSS
jgi:predicted ATP-binding protein involved in virulence